VRQTIADLHGTIAEDEEDCVESRRLANQLDEMAGLGVVYADAELRTSTVGSMAVGCRRRDESAG
jgi:hypothetical protein